MKNNSRVDINSTAVQTHLQLYQNILARMANNSSSVKTWCVTVVSAILVLLIDREEESALPLAMIPVSLFFVLDVYYLSLEKRFRWSYNHFVKNLHRENGNSEIKLFEIVSDKQKIKSIKESICSFSIWPFYLLIVVGIWISVVFVDSLTFVETDGVAMLVLQGLLG